MTFSSDRKTRKTFEYSKVIQVVNLMHNGLSLSFAKKLHFKIESTMKYLGFESQKTNTTVRAHSLGWFKKIPGQLSGNVAYNIYSRLNPSNIDISKPIQPEDLRRTYLSLKLRHPHLTLEKDPIHGVDLNRIFRLLESIREEKTTNFNCASCHTTFLKLANQASTKCPHCYLIQKKIEPIIEPIEVDSHSALEHSIR